MENKVRFVLDCPIEIDGVLYKAKVVPRFQNKDIVSLEKILVLTEIEEKEG